MRIAILTSKGERNKGYEVPPHLIGPGFETQVVETCLPIFPYNQLDQKLMEVSTIEGALRAAGQGFHAIFINTVGDYGLESLRSAIRIPVVGASQATMLIAASLGRRFSIVTIWPPSLRYLYEDLVVRYGVSDRCVSIRHVSSEEELVALHRRKNFVTEMRRGEKRMLSRIIDHCKQALVQDGADTVMLGCTCMAPIANQIARSCKVPVLDPMTTGYKFTELLLCLGLTQSPLAFRPSPTKSAAAFSFMTRMMEKHLEDQMCQICDISRSSGK